VIIRLENTNFKDSRATKDIKDGEFPPKVESCLGKRCHVLIEQGKQQNHPNVSAIDVENLQLPMFTRSAFGNIQ
jgi:hypothetical protein